MVGKARFLSKLLSSIFFILFISPCRTQEMIQRDTFSVTLDDKKEILLRLYRHERIPQFYSSSIFTQVCETGECKPVSIILYWDLLGNYLRYALPDGQILTKLDHIPFTAEDYEKFEKILADPYSVLEDFAIDELTGSREKARIDEIDGITGATPKSISNSIVEGAVYTCYTIWHLAHGKISGHIAAITDSLATSGRILNEFIKSEEIDLRYWATKKLFRQPEKYPDEVRNLITSFDPTDIFGIKNLLNELPDDLLHQSWVQEHLWHQYEKYNFSLQKLLLEKYQHIPVDRHLKGYILTLATKGNHRQQKLFNSLVFKAD